MKNLEVFFNEVRLNAGAIWFENETIQFAAPRKFQNQEADDFIINNKGQIIAVLKENRIFSVESFFNTIIIKNNFLKFYPLSPAQERVWFIEQYEQGSNAYHIPTTLELDVDTDIEGVKYALQQIVSRHEVLRSTIEQGERQDNAIQIVHETPLTIHEITISDKEDYKSLIKEDINRPFNLSAEYPIRVKFYTVRQDEDVAENKSCRTLLLVNMHHISSDAWSIEIFQRELYAYYDAYIKGDRDFRLPELEIQYKDFAVWQRSYLTGEILEKQLSHWKEKLSGYQTLALPTDYVRPHQIDYRGTYDGFLVDKEISTKLRALAQRYGTTLHTVLLSSMNIMLGKYTGQEDIITGSPIANRHHRQTQNLIGFFVNTQVNRALLNKTQTYEDLIQQVHQDQIEAQLYQDLPFEKLIDDLGVERDISRHPVFQVSFEVNSAGSRNKVADDNKKYFRHFEAGSVYETTKFDLSIYFYDGRDYLAGIINYATSLFRKDSIKTLIQHYTYLLQQLTEAPDKPYSELSLLRPEEYDQIIYKWNDTDKEYPKDKTVYQLFQEQAEKTPENIALVYQQYRLTYRELNEKSNQLARYIRVQYQQKTKKELQADTLIALCLDRSLEMVIGILAVLKAGGAYVPIDANYPQERINYILADTRAELVLSQRTVGEGNEMQLPADKVIYIELSEELYVKEIKSNLPQHSDPTNLAYVIYTSGTTGKPKGVMVEHRNVTRLFTCTDHQFGFNASDVWTLFHSYVFDFSVWELWGALIHGGKLIVIPQEQTKDFGSFYHLCREYKVSVLNQTPSAFYRFAEIAGNSNQSDLALRYIIFGGEALNVEQLRSWWNYQTNNGLSAKLINMYGITETTVHVTYKELSEDEFVQSNIGKPLGDLKAYILDSNNNPVPVGVIGELYIGGAGLARGYLNQLDLTGKRFIPNPFATQADKEKGYTRLYKTGDVVRWLPDGNIEFKGRNDDQVKIRGYRIEIKEIEYALAQIAGIKQSCVLAKERTTETGNTKYLVGYYVLDNNADTPIQSTILNKLSQTLPEYMLPAALVHLQTFPLTINGKLDKQALPDLDFSSSLEEYVAPTTETEITMCRVWQSVLGLERVGMNDDFFRIGGNSILAIQVSHQMSKSLGCDIKVADVFRHKTISQLLPHTIGKTEIRIPRKETDHAVLSFAQERLWFIEQYEQGTNAYHMPAVLELEVDTDIEGIKYALHEIVRRHEVLRSTIQRGERQEHGIQVVHETPLTIEEITISDKEDYISLLKEDINRPFDLSAEYPIRVKFYTVQPDQRLTVNRSCRTLLVINMHHIASDGWSIGIFQKELLTYYEAYIKSDRDFKLPPLEIQYKDYAVWQRSYLTGEILQKQLSYWKEKLSGYQTLAFPTDYVRPQQMDYSGSNKTFTLNEEISKKVRALAQRYGTTLHSVLLSSMNVLLGKYTGQEDIITGSPIANRHYRQTEDLIGFFVNMQINRALLNKTQSYEDLIQQVHHDQIEAQFHQDLPFEKLVDELEIERDVSRHPVFQVSFVVQSFGNQGKFAAKQKMYFKASQVEDIHETTRFDLSVFIDDSQEYLIGNINYATSLFGEESIKRLINHYTYLLEKLTEAPNKPYSQINLLSPHEYNQIVYKWNETYTEYPKDKTVHQLFQELAEKTPDSIALVYEGQELTYKELNEKSNQLARYIRAQYRKRTNQEVNPDTFIALYLDRSLEMVIGILAVLKTGGAYVPIDTIYPTERINYILKDTRAELVLSQKHLAESSRLQLPEDNVIQIDLCEELYKAEDTSNLLQYSQATDLAYVIYTSGTTGNPKGVMVEHCNVTRLFTCTNHQFGFNASDVWTLFHSYVFDFSVWELWGALIYGGKLIVISQEQTKDFESFYQLCVKYKVSVLNQTPSAFYRYAEIANNSSQSDLDLRYIIFGGEALNNKQLETWWSYQKNNRLSAKLINMYGITETTVHVTYKELSEDEVVQSNIGKSLGDLKLYVLDSSNNPVPVGVTGELYIGGAGVARGYLNRPDLTEERFIPNPFATQADKEKGYTRLYKTGDLVRWLPDGNLEFIGRNDGQVKIRGYRIELGEIEHALAKIAGIKQSCVLAREKKTEFGSNKYLAGYYVLDSKYVSNNYDDILDSWENLYDTEYDKEIEEVDVESDFTGWNSYITGESIPLHEMRQWRDCIVGIIRKLNPSRVLEIGVGTGLLMYPLLKDVQRYTGLDISQSVIERHKKYLKDKKHNVEFYHLRADQVDQLPLEDFYDTIIINSVCQYFPNIGYFDDVLDKAIHKLSASGSIFLGDIRNHDLHKELIQEKLDYAGENYTHQDIERIALKENELLISPRYFFNLKKRYKDIKVDIYERTGIYENELSKYRYDVVISVEGKSFRSSTNGIAGNSISNHGYSTNNHNIPFLNQLSKEDIHRQLSTVLPSYMIPDALVVIGSFPLTINGKLDKAALPDPDFNSSDEYVAPTTETEIAICRTWQSVLGLERVGITDNFFRIGGNSILAIQVAHRMSKVLHQDVKVADVFRFKNIAELLENINCKKSDDKRIELVF